MSTIEYIIALTLVEIERVTNRYAEDEDWHTWEMSVRKAIATGHSASTWMAVRERTLEDQRAQWIKGEQGAHALPVGDKQRLELITHHQFCHLRRFAEEAPGFNKSALVARVNLYAGAIRSTYYETRWSEWDIPYSLIPGNQQCLGNCRCTVSVLDKNDGTGVLVRIMGREKHCAECLPLAGNHIVKRSKT